MKEIDTRKMAHADYRDSLATAISAKLREMGTGCYAAEQGAFATIHVLGFGKYWGAVTSTYDEKTHLRYLYYIPRMALSALLWCGEGMAPFEEVVRKLAWEINKQGLTD